MKCKSLILSFFRWALSILGLASFASCEGGAIGGVCMYGMPSMDFTVSGKVMDVKNNPINGIEVTTSNENVYVPTKVATDEKGEFTISGNGWPEDTINLTFTDVDGEQNGGDFQTATEQVHLTQTKKTDDVWYKGVYEAKGVKVTLTEKK